MQQHRKKEKCMHHADAHRLSTKGKNGLDMSGGVLQLLCYSLTSSPGVVPAPAEHLQPASLTGFVVAVYQFAKLGIEPRIELLH